MDTGTHIAMGVALTGLALVDPIVASDSATHGAVVIGAIAGSLIPDIDTVLKMRNNAVYIRNHRGITHSIPAVIMWPILLTLLLSFFYPDANLWHVWAWTFLAVFLHVFVDVFNAYGTQALRPFSREWIALSVINTFDPIIFAMHMIAFVIWWWTGQPVATMFGLLATLIVYYILRFALKKAVTHAVFKTVPNATEVFVAPTIRFFEWRIVVSSETSHYVGRAYRRSVTLYDEFKRLPLPTEEKVVKVAMTDFNMRAFTSFSPTYRWVIDRLPTDDGYEVRLIDLRYRNKGHYPFVAVVHVSDDLTIKSSYTGWIFSEQKLQQKLEPSK